MPIKIGNITIYDWEKNDSGSWRRHTDDFSSFGSEIYAFKIADKDGKKLYTVAFFNKLEFLREHHKLMYGDITFKTLHEAKDNIDLFLIRFSNLKAFL